MQGLHHLSMFAAALNELNKLHDSDRETGNHIRHSLFQWPWNPPRNHFYADIRRQVL